MKRFGAISTLCLPLLVAQGMFSMNVEVPGRDVNNLAWFGGITSTFLAIIVIGFFIFKRIDWW